MINLSTLYCGATSGSDGLRYGARQHAPDQPATPRSAAERRPVTVWNITQSCNLRCLHCYSDSEARRYEGELSTEEGYQLLWELARFNVPAVLFSGGEPLVRRDLFDLAVYARFLGLRPTLSTNGTLITPEVARRIKMIGFTYVGISLDGIGEVNDRFRGVQGAFDRALRAFHNCKAVGQRVGLRLTMNRHNAQNLHQIFDLIEREGIDRACFYHLVPAGRGRAIGGEFLSPAEDRAAVDIIIDRTADLIRRGRPVEILTVDNHVDGVHAYLRLLREGSPRAEEVLRQLRWNGGGTYSSGVGIADIDFQGNVHPDQFWMHYNLGNVRRRLFGSIWMDTSDPIMAGLKNRRPLLKGRCRKCRFVDACGGSLRVRADRVYGDPWAPDPGCYLTDEEIGLTPADQAELEAAGEAFPAPVPSPLSLVEVTHA
jgi:radical SAM protein with 4Fe4S-binding SPASM domain